MRKKVKKKVTKKKAPRRRSSSVTVNTFNRTRKVQNEKFAEVWNEIARLDGLVSEFRVDDNVKNAISRIRTNLKRAEDNSSGAVHASDEVKKRLALLEAKIGPVGTEAPELTAFRQKLDGLDGLVTDIANRVSGMAKPAARSGFLGEQIEGLRVFAQELGNRITRLEDPTEADLHDPKIKPPEPWPAPVNMGAIDIQVLGQTVEEIRRKVSEHAVWRTQVTAAIREWQDWKKQTNVELREFPRMKRRVRALERPSEDEEPDRRVNSPARVAVFLEALALLVREGRETGL